MSRESAMASVIPAATPAPAVEATPTNVETKTVGDVSSSDPNVQALLKKEVRLVQEREAFKKQQAEHAEKIRQADLLLARDKEFDETKKKDVTAALKMLGFSDTEIFNAVAAQAPTEKTPEEVAEEAARRVLKENNDRLEVERVSLESKKNAEAIDRFQKSIASAIDASPEKYEFCKFYGDAAKELIYETVAATLKDTQKLLTVTEATDLVEAYYEERSKAMDALKKRKPVEAPVEVKAEVKKETILTPKVSEQPKPTKTLTNRVTATATTGQRSESPSEKRERLANVLRTGDTTLLRR